MSGGGKLRFVSTNTREGRVLQKLFERLEQIELDIDPQNTGKVFNVLGDLFPANGLEKMLREMYLHNLTEDMIKARIVQEVDSDRFRKITESTLEGLGTAPLDDSLFRTAVFEQIGESKLEGAVTTDICGKKGSHAVRLDQEATADIKKARLHRKVMTAIFFESNGGQAKGEATEPEIRLAVGEPDWDIGHIDTVLESLNQTCYYLNSERRRFRFSLSPNLNKLLADRRASISDQKISERVRAEVKKTFAKSEGMDVRLFPEKSGDITDRPVLTLAIMPPEQTMEDGETRQRIEAMTKEYGKSARTYKTGVIWCAASSTAKLRDEARKLLAWEDMLAYVGKKGHGRYEPFVFKKPIQPADIEISDEMYIVQADEAQKHIEPQRLSNIVLFPDAMTLQPGARIQFRAEGRDQHGRAMATGGINWTASGGKVETNGTFIAPDVEGHYSVEAAVADVKATAHVSVDKQSQPTLIPGFEPVSPKPASSSVSRIQWTGEVPSAKWMTFYTKVLAKYAKEKGLTLKASFTLNPQQGLSKQQVDELRSALHELGLDDNVET